MFEFIQVTAQYSNAVLVAILPQISEFSQKLELPLSLPVNLEHVEQFNCDPHKSQIGGWLRLTNGFDFWYGNGYVTGFASPDSYYHLQEFTDLTEFYGPVKMSAKEAVQLARDSLRRLGYSETALYADGTPQITRPPIVRSKVVPRYRIRWVEPEAGGVCLDMEIDAEHKTLKGLTVMNNNLSRDPPKVSVEPPPLDRGQVPTFMKDVPPEIAAMYQRMTLPGRLTQQQEQTLLRAILPVISDYGRKLDLPIRLPITTNEVASFDTQFFPGQTYLTLMSGYEFVYGLGYVQEFRAPYSFFIGKKLDGRIEEYWGRWRISEREAVKLARETIEKLGYSLKTLHLDGKPKVKKPIEIGEHDIPRYRLRWEFSLPESDDDQQVGIISATEIEVDADKKSVKAISIYDASLIRPPPLDLPGRSSPRSLDTNSVPRLWFLTNSPPKPAIK